GGDSGVAGHAESWRVDVRGAELEAADVDVGRRVAARAVAVEAADRDVVIRQPGDRNRVARWWSGERSGARSVAGETTSHALVNAGDRVDRVVARGGVALGTGRGCRDVVRGLARTAIEVAGEGRCRGVTAAALASRRVARIECRRGTRVTGGGVRAGDHAEERRRLVALLAACDRGGYGAVAGDTERRGIDV